MTRNQKLKAAGFVEIRNGAKAQQLYEAGLLWECAVHRESPVIAHAWGDIVKYFENFKTDRAWQFFVLLEE